jgi:hypothetical protein
MRYSEALWKLDVPSSQVFRYYDGLLYSDEPHARQWAVPDRPAAALRLKTRPAGSWGVQSRRSTRTSARGPTEARLVRPMAWPGRLWK